MPEKPVKANDHESYGSFTLITILLPLVGFILGVAFITKDQKVDRKLGEHLLALSILMGIIYGIGLSVWIFKITRGY